MSKKFLPWFLFGAKENTFYYEERDEEMTKKDFELIAKIIREISFFTEEERKELATQFADKLRYTNAAFNKDRFINAATNTGKRNADK